MKSSEGGKKKGDWPICYNRLKKFTEDDELKKIHFFNSVKHCHGIEPIPKTDKNKEGQLPCTLCAKRNIFWNTSKRCSTCLIPLCTKRLKTENVNSNDHFTKWHSVVDLKRENQKCLQKLKETRPKATTADGNEEEDHDDNDGDEDDDSDDRN